MTWRGKKIINKKSENALTSVVSIIIITAIITGTVTTIFSTGLTEINNIEGKKNEHITESNFNLLSESFTKISSNRYMGKTYLNNLQLQGNINIDTEKLDRLIIFYSLNPNYDFYVSMLNDVDSEIIIFQTGSLIAHTLEISNIDRKGTLTYIGTFDIPNSGENTIDTYQNLQGYLLFNLSSESNEVIGRILLIDSPCLSFINEDSDLEIILNKIGILYFSDQGYEIKKQSLININDDYVGFRIFQFINDYSVNLNLNENTNIYFENEGINNFGLEKAYFLKLQIYNDYSQEWNDYFDEKFNGNDSLFSITQDATLLYIPSTIKEVLLSITYSNIKFDYK